MEFNVQKYPFSWELGWSNSRFDTFSSCKRRYYYQYYAKRNDKSVHKKTLARLLSLTSIPLEIGSVTHKLLAQILDRLVKSTKPIDQDRLILMVRRQIRDVLDNNEFFEVYYGEKNEITEQDLLPDIQESVFSFLGSERFTWVEEQAKNPKRHWIIEPKGFGEGRIDDMKVYCKIDFMFIVDDKVVILDWKTGKEDKQKHTKQLLAYATYAVHEWGLDPGQIETVVAYLRPEYTEFPVSAPMEILNEFADQIRWETDEMKRLCTDVAENRPRPKDDFPLIPESRFCSYCNFKQLCGRE